MMLLFSAKHILHNNLPVSVYLVTSVLPSADMRRVRCPQLPTDYNQPHFAVESEGVEMVI